MAPSNDDNSGTNLGRATNNCVGMIYNFIKFIFTALFCIVSFFVCGIYKLCKKEEEEEKEKEGENAGKKKSAAKKKTGP
jgi:hypothetical protein